MLFWYNRTIHELMPATHVDFQSIRSTKLHLAHIAFVRFLVRVNTHVLLIMRMCDVIREEGKKVKKLKK